MMASGETFLAQEHSITQWIQALRQGEGEAAQRLWEAYSLQIIGLARRRLSDYPRRAIDEEDVALSAFDSLCRGARAGRFPRLDDRNDLWQVLFLITIRKVSDLKLSEGRKARRAGAVRSLSDLSDEELALLPQDGPDPGLAALLADECRARMERLGDPTLRSVAALKLEGYTNQEIAERIGCSIPTVERKLRRIRNIWDQNRSA
jgi:RNA polymerase sigma factor (sigma-70 family)